ncbi:hypothetical protein K438DRAFT_2010142 [Mycena galopus ATCC 62051]|nr:hypothetical protein K438DRAFT_2010142 [Mycena galopus ATCC 62051]
MSLAFLDDERRKENRISRAQKIGFPRVRAEATCSWLLHPLARYHIQPRDLKEDARTPNCAMHMAGEGRTSAIRAAALENAGSGLQHLDVVHVLADSNVILISVFRETLVLSIAAFSVIDHTDATFLRAEALETARVSAFQLPLLWAAMPSGLATAHPRRSRMRTQAAGKRPDSIYISVDHLSRCPFQ